MALACLIAAVGIFLDSPILIVGAMIVGPEYGPLAGLSVAIVQRRRDVARRSLPCAGRRVPGRHHRRVPVRPRAPSDRPRSGGFRGHRPSAHRVHLAARPVLVHRRLHRGHRRRPGADLLEVRGADRRPGLGDHDPRRGQHRPRLRVRRVARVAWRDAAAGDQPDGDRARRGPDAVRPAALLHASPPRTTSRTRPVPRRGCPWDTAGAVGNGSRRPRSPNEPHAPPTCSCCSASFAGATAIAAALGAANFGTALTFGQIAFAATLVWVLLRRDSGAVSRARRAAARPASGRRPW